MHAVCMCVGGLLGISLILGALLPRKPGEEFCNFPLIADDHGHKAEHPGSVTPDESHPIAQFVCNDLIGKRRVSDLSNKMLRASSNSLELSFLTLSLHCSYKFSIPVEFNVSVNSSGDWPKAMPCAMIAPHLDSVDFTYAR
jgi:hypothetical protein